ncbi:MAG TPA: GNAT family N-acetyltransferase [Nocardioidaceae bacterium]|nr:GNAT family N-acetyltransferase [Nocardioidaceae bacterium]
MTNRDRTPPPASADPDARHVELERLGLGRYRATNVRGGTLLITSGTTRTGDEDHTAFTPVELLLVAAAGCTAADVDHITAKRAEPDRFQVRSAARKARDEGGNHLRDLQIDLEVEFPTGPGGDAARSILPDAAARSHDRLCTVSRTLERGTPVQTRVAGEQAGRGSLADLQGRTERLELRAYRPEDLAAFADLHAREDVTRYLPWPVRDADAARAALERHQRMRLDRDGDGITLAGFEPDTGRLVGEFVLILRSNEHGGGELGYLLHPDFQGRGLATEGARAALELAFERLRWRRVIARIDARNTASARVLQRLGMRHEAHLVQNELFKGEWSDEDDYAMLSAEWSASRPAHVVTWCEGNVDG